jgi:NitT/TauT family transport system permease protein
MHFSSALFFQRRVRWALSALVLVGAVVLWHWTSGRTILGTHFHEIILPPPAEVAEALWKLVVEDTSFLLEQLQVTAVEIFMGFLLGSALGLGLGLVLIAAPLMRKMLYPYIVIHHSMPGVVVAPIIIAWFGFGPNSKIVQAMLGTFFPILINTMVGLTLVDENGLRLMQSLTASRWQVFIKFRLPTALPAIFSGVRIGLTFAVIGAIVSEFLAAERGLGQLIQRYHFELRVAEMYAVILIVAIIGLVLFFLVEWLDRKLIFWREDPARQLWRA